MLPVTVHTPVAGSYSSPLAKGGISLPMPPATSTYPFCSKVAVCDPRPTPMLPVAIHIPVAGSCSSALAKGGKPPLPRPPATSYLPIPQQRRRLECACSDKVAGGSPPAWSARWQRLTQLRGGIVSPGRAARRGEDQNEASRVKSKVN